MFHEIEHCTLNSELQIIRDNHSHINFMESLIRQEFKLTRQLQTVDSSLSSHWTHSNLSDSGPDHRFKSDFVISTPNSQSYEITWSEEDFMNNLPDGSSQTDRPHGQIRTNISDSRSYNVISSGRSQLNNHDIETQYTSLYNTMMTVKGPGAESSESTPLARLLSKSAHTVNWYAGLLSASPVQMSSETFLTHHNALTSSSATFTSQSQPDTSNAVMKRHLLRINQLPLRVLLRDTWPSLRVSCYQCWLDL